MRLVSDTSVLVAAIRSNQGRSNRLLAAALQRRCTLLASVPLMLEYEAVLTRPEHLQAAGLTAAEIGVLLDAIAAVAEPVRLTFLWRPLLSQQWARELASRPGTHVVATAAQVSEF